MRGCISIQLKQHDWASQCEAILNVLLAHEEINAVQELGTKVHNLALDLCMSVSGEKPLWCHRDRQSRSPTPYDVTPCFEAFTAIYENPSAHQEREKLVTTKDKINFYNKFEEPTPQSLLHPDTLCMWHHIIHAVKQRASGVDVNPSDIEHVNEDNSTSPFTALVHLLIDLKLKGHLTEDITSQIGSSLRFFPSLRRKEDPDANRLRELTIKAKSAEIAVWVLSRVMGLHLCPLSETKSFTYSADAETRELFERGNQMVIDILMNQKCAYSAKEMVCFKSIFTDFWRLWPTSSWEFKMAKISPEWFHREEDASNTECTLEPFTSPKADNSKCPSKSVASTAVHLEHTSTATKSLEGTSNYKKKQNVAEKVNKLLAATLDRKGKQESEEKVKNSLATSPNRKQDDKTEIGPILAEEEHLTSLSKSRCIYNMPMHKDNYLSGIFIRRRHRRRRRRHRLRRHRHHLRRHRHHLRRHRKDSYGIRRSELARIQLVRRLGGRKLRPLHRRLMADE